MKYWAYVEFSLLIIYGELFSWFQLASHTHKHLWWHSTYLQTIFIPKYWCTGGKW